MSRLIPANENPWYVLATIHGEQPVGEMDWDLHDANRAAWNAWSCQHLTDAERGGIEQRLDLVAGALGDWTDFEAEVTRLFRKRLGKDAKLPHALTTVDFTEVLFENPLILMNFVFATSVTFRRAALEQRATFLNGYFGDWAVFANTEFRKDVSFDSAIFADEAMFLETRFDEFANFNGVQFAGDTQFSQALFAAPVDFSEIVVSQGAGFDNTKFGGEARFRNARFSGRVEFSESSFDGRVDLRHAVFATEFPRFDGAILHPMTLFTAQDRGMSGFPGKEREVRLWPADQPDKSAARDSCGVIRHVLSEQARPEDAQFFFRKELWFAGRTDEPFLRRLPFLLYGWMSDYGHSIARPVIGLLLLWLVPALVFVAYFAWQSGLHGGPNAPIEALPLSFANLFAFFGFQRLYFGVDYLSSLPTALRMLAAMQTMLGFVLLFFLGLGLRNRFRLR